MTTMSTQALGMAPMRKSLYCNRSQRAWHVPWYSEARNRRDADNRMLTRHRQVPATARARFIALPCVFIFLKTCKLKCVLV